MRILLIHWDDIAAPEGRGGGVTVYQRALVRALAQRPGVQVETLSAGVGHDLIRRAPRVALLGTAPCPRHAVVNSGLLAPSHAHFGNPAQLTHPATERALAAFLDHSGPWDVIHFNTLEGLPAEALRVAADHVRRAGRGRVVLSLHNYYPFCPQVNLWHHETTHCDDFHDGARCVTCLPVATRPALTRAYYRLAGALTPLGMGPGTAVFDRVVWRGLRGALHRLRSLRIRSLRRRRGTSFPASGGAAQAAAFRDRRAAMITLINRHVDDVLCVSDRVRQIALGFGLDPARLRTDYIGTDQARLWRTTQAPACFPRQSGGLHLAYLGYMRRDKGFFFLMRALLALPTETARRLTLTVAAHRGEGEAMDLLSQVRAHLGGVIHVDGYRHEDLDGILAPVDLGLIPVLWEDNMPQVALEMHARHIPLLTSDRGGAQELALSPGFVFRAGDAADFAARIQALLDGAVDPGPLWAGARAPTSIDAHVDTLLAVYRGAS